MTQAECLTLDWDAQNTAQLAAHGLSFSVSDECGEEPYQGFYWREESANRPMGSFDSPDEAKRAAQDWVRKEVPRMAFLIEVDEEDAAEENIPSGHYLLNTTHLPMLNEDDVHDAAGLLGVLAREQALPQVFETAGAARGHAVDAGLTLHDPAFHGLELRSERTMHNERG